MTQGEGLVGLLYAIKGLFEAGIIIVLSGLAMIFFFGIIVKYIGDKYGLWGQKGALSGSGKMKGSTIVYALFLLFVIFAVYSLIELFVSIFGLNNAPVGGLDIR